MVIEVAFVDRLKELEVLRSVVARGTYLPLYIYGPEGCGKTRLLREFLRVVVEDSSCVAIYVDALEASSVERAVIASSPVVEIVKEVIECLARSLGSVYPVGSVVARYIGRVVEEVVKRFGLGGKSLVVAVDDVVSAIGMDRVEWYLKWLYELIHKLSMEYRPRSIAVVATTSEGESLERVLRHSYTSVALLWNLSREGFEELLKQLGLPSPSLVDELWRLVGGNPRKAIEIAVEYHWNTEMWLDSLVRQLRPVYEELKRLGLDKHLEDVIEDPDSLSDKPIELPQILRKHNLVIYKWIRTLSGEEVARDPDLGIGKYYAWQVPAYRHALKKLLT